MFVRKEQLKKRWNLQRSAIDARVRQGLLTKPVSLGGGTCVAWPEHEIVAIEQARLGGWDDGQVRALVCSLMEARQAAADEAARAKAYAEERLRRAPVSAPEAHSEPQEIAA